MPVRIENFKPIPTQAHVGQYEKCQLLWLELTHLQKTYINMK